MLFGIGLSIFVGVVIYSGLTDFGGNHLAAAIIGLGGSFITLLVFNAWFECEHQWKSSHQRRKLGSRRKYR